MNSVLSATIERFYLYLPVILSFIASLPAVSAEEYRIGVVDAQAVLEQAPQAEKMSSELRKEFESRNREIIEMQKKLTEINERLTNDSVIMTQENIEKLEREKYKLSRDLNRAEDEYKEDLSYRRNEILVALQEEIIDAIQIVSEKNNFDIVLSEGVNWASPSVNMTQLVIEYLKKKAEE